MYGVGARLRAAKVLLVTALELPAPLPELVRAGVGMVAIRDEEHSDQELARELAALRCSVPPGRILLGVCDRTGAGDAADFVQHRACLGEEGGGSPPLGKLVGSACGTQKAFDAALAHPAIGYICLGPAPAPGLIRHAAARAPQADAAAKVWFACGGVDQGNLAALAALGARRIAVGDALTQAGDPVAAAAALSAALRQVWAADPAMEGFALRSSAVAVGR
jgi:thiamine-phosphate pyrophosphorylase